jgi:ribonucleoside-diphosphate reductase alpha chain
LRELSNKKSYIELNNEVKVKKDGRYQFEKDKEAVRAYFIDHVNENMRFYHDEEEKYDYLLENDYYDKQVFNMYSFNQVKKIAKYVYGKEFRFPSFMSAFKFYNNYAMQNNDKSRFLERYEDRIVVNALYLGDGNFKEAMEHAQELIEQTVQPATPTFLNAGRARGGEKVSCFLLDTPDSTEGIEYVKESVAQLSRRGGGVGVSVSKIRASGESILDIEGAASGIIGVARMIEATVAYYNQLGQRKGSAVVNVTGHHPDSGKLLEAKKINADDAVRLKTLSIAILVTNKMIEKLKADEPFYQFYPNSVFKEYGQYMDEMDMDVWYDKLVENPNVKKKMVNTRDFFNDIAITQQQSGYPYIIFIDNANKQNPLRELGRIVMSNLCTEIHQHFKLSDVKGRHLQSDWGQDVSCNLASLNIVNVMDKKRIREAVRAGMNALNTVAKRTSIDCVPTIKNGNDRSRSVGLGVMNLNGFYAKNFIMYESREAKDFANTFFMMMNYYSIERSMEIAIEDKFVFEGFEKTDYANGRYFKKYKEHSFAPRTEKVQELFEGIYIPTQEDWEVLAEKVAKNGLANGYRLAIAPTGNISYVQSSTAGIEPVKEKIETRKYEDSTTQYPMPYMTSENEFFYKEAYDIDMMKYIDLVSVIQQHLDQGISATLFVDSHYTSEQLVRLYAYAHDKGMKALYYTRTKLLTDIDECEQCSV